MGGRGARFLIVKGQATELLGIWGGHERRGAMCLDFYVDGKLTSPRGRKDSLSSPWRLCMRCRHDAHTGCERCRREPREPCRLAWSMFALVPICEAKVPALLQRPGEACGSLLDSHHLRSEIFGKAANPTSPGYHGSESQEPMKKVETARRQGSQLFVYQAA